eukprot:gene19274-biopygen14445
MRRFELQARRDDGFGYCMFNLSFREALQRQTFLQAYRNPRVHGMEAVTTATWQEIVAVLESRKAPTFDSIMQLKDVSWEAKQVVRTLRLATGAVPGTRSLRDKMRHQAGACGVYYGDAVFVTISPNSRQSSLVMRLFRCWRDDPCVRRCKHLGRMDFPSLNGRTADAQFEFEMPDYDDRRAAAAADPTACVEAYRILIRAVLTELFGCVTCSQCPACACRAPDGSVATERGGVFGWVNGYFGATECQSTGDLHAHFMRGRRFVTGLGK